MNILMRLLPHVPSRRIALEPERKVGSTAVSPGFPLARICSQLPAGGDPYLIFKVEGLPETYRTPQEKPIRRLHCLGVEKGNEL